MALVLNVMKMRYEFLANQEKQQFLVYQEQQQQQKQFLVYHELRAKNEMELIWTPFTYSKKSQTDENNVYIGKKNKLTDV